MSRSVAGDTYEHHVGHESRKRENLLSLVEAIDPQSYLEIGAQPTAASSNRPAPALVVLIKAVLSVALRTRSVLAPMDQLQRRLLCTGFNAGHSSTIVRHAGQRLERIALFDWNYHLYTHFCAQVYLGAFGC